MNTNFFFQKKFVHKRKKLDQKIRDKFEERLKLFKENPTHPILNIHKLSGEYGGLWSMNVTSDYRAIFNKGENSLIIFVNIGTHDELFG